MRGDAAKGYPGDVEAGSIIRGVELADELSETIVFHAATKRDGHRLLANGGRGWASPRLGLR